MSTHQPLQYEEDGLLTPNLGFVASNEDIETSARQATQGDAFRSEMSGLTDGPIIEVHPCPNPKQRVYAIQALLMNTAGEATPLWVDLWTALTSPEVAGIFGVTSATMVDRFSFGVTLGMAFNFDVIHDQIIALILSNITLHPEAEVSMKDVRMPAAAEPLSEPITATEGPALGRTVAKPAPPVIYRQEADPDNGPPAAV